MQRKQDHRRRAIKLSRSFIARIFPLREDELSTGLLFALYFFLAIATVNLVKSLQDALYLSRLGFDYRLPALYICLAVLSGPVVLLLRRLTYSHSIILVSSATIALLSLFLIGFLLVLDAGKPWTFIAFYVWGTFFGTLLPSQGWILSYQVFPGASARRLFGLFGTGGVLGGVAGGFYTASVAHLMSPQLLLFQVLLTLILLLFLLTVIWRINRHRIADSRLHDDHVAGAEGPVSLQAFRRTPHLWYLAAIVFLSGLVTTLVALEFKWVVLDRYSGSTEDMTRVFAGFLGLVYLISAAFQLLGTGPLLRKFGLGIGLLVLPLGLWLGAVGVVFTAAFWAVVVMKGIDGFFRPSIDRTSLEILYVPVSGKQSLALKSLMELVVSRLGDGLGAGFVLILLFAVDDPIRAGAVLILLAATWWMLASREATEQYAKSLRKNLERGRVPMAQRALELNEAVAEKTLVASLTSENADKVCFALQQLLKNREVETQELTDFRVESFDADLSGIYEVSSRTPKWLELVEQLTGHSDVRVAATALALLALHKSDEYGPLIAEKLGADTLPELKYLVLLEKYPESVKGAVEPDRLLGWVEKASAEEAAILARIMAETRDPVYLDSLVALTDGSTRALRRAAIRALGLYRDPAYVELLIRHLGYRWSCRAARAALINYGEMVIPRLISLLRDSKVDLWTKREVPYIMTRINSRSSRAGLVASLYTYDSVVSYRALKGLNNIREFEELSYNQESFIPLLQMWAREYYELLNLDYLFRSVGKQPCALLRRALRERLDWTIERIFRGLDLYLPLGDAYFSYLAYMSNSTRMREDAIELIDQRIRGELRQTLVPIFLEQSQEAIVQQGREMFKLPADLDEGLAEALFGGDPWFKCCVLAEISQRAPQTWKERIAVAERDINPLVRETATWVVRTWSSAAS